MNIAIIVPSLKDKAPVNIAMSIANKLSERGNKLTVFYLSNCIEIGKSENIEYFKLSFFNKFSWKKFDIVHSHMFLPDAFVFFKKPFFSKIKTVTTIHNYVFHDLNNNFNKIISFFLGLLWIIFWTRTNKLVVLSNDAIKYYSSKSINKKFRKIYNGKDLLIENDFKRNHTELINKKRKEFVYTLGVIASLVSSKKIDVLIRHISRVKNGYLIIIGDGPQRISLNKLVKNYNLENRIIFLGQITKAHHYNTLFDIFIFPSINEGFGLSLIEAALHRKKIVCSDIPVFREIFDDSEVTFFESNNEISIDNAIEVALKDNQKPIRAHEKAKKLYSEEKMTDNYFKLYSDLTKYN